MIWQLAIIPAAIVGCLIGCAITPDDKDLITMNDFIAQKVEQYESPYKPFGDMQAAAYVYGVTEDNIDSFKVWF